MKNIKDLIDSVWRDASAIPPTCALAIWTAWLTKDILTPLLFLEKSFDGRSLPVKMALISVYILVFYILFVKVVPKLARRLTGIYPAALAAVYGASLATYIILGFFSRLFVDDYCSAAKARALGILPGAWFWYMSWSGRYSAHLYDALMGWFGARLTPFSTLVILCLWMGALIYFFRNSRFFIVSGRQQTWPVVLLAAMTLFATLEITPNVFESLLWGQGMRSVVPPLILASGMAGLLAKHAAPFSGDDQNIFPRYLILVIVVIMAGGFAETYTALQVFLFISLCLYIRLFRKNTPGKFTALAWAGLIAAMFALAVMILAPGNRARQPTYQQTTHIVELLRISLMAMFSFLGQILRSPIDVLTLSGIFFTCMAISSRLADDRGLRSSCPLGNKIPINMLAALMFALMAVFVCFIPSAYAMSASPPGRTLIIPTYVLVCAAAWIGCQAGWLVRGWLVEKPIIRKKSFIMVVLAHAALTAFSLIALETTAGNIARAPGYLAFARQWDQVDALIAREKLGGAEHITVPNVRHPSELDVIGFSGWAQSCASEFYQIKVDVGEYFY